jgi:hypothetical protein
MLYVLHCLLIIHYPYLRGLHTVRYSFIFYYILFSFMLLCFIPFNSLFIFDLFYFVDSPRERYKLILKVRNRMVVRDTIFSLYVTRTLAAFVALPG